MKTRTVIAKTSAFLGLTGYLFWFAGPLYELAKREPNWWVFGLVCSIASAYLVSQLFRRLSLRTDSAPRLLVRYFVGAVASYVPMAVLVLSGAQLCLRLSPKPDPNNEGALFAGLMTLWVPLWGLPFGGSMGMVRRKRRAVKERHPTPG